MSAEVGRAAEQGVYGEVADRLERIARQLRDGGPGALLSSNDPLTSLIVGFAMGVSAGARSGR